MLHTHTFKTYYFLLSKSSKNDSTNKLIKPKDSFFFLSNILQEMTIEDSGKKSVEKLWIFSHNYKFKKIK